MTDDQVLAQPCPACGDPYGDHALATLAWCMEALYDGMGWEEPEYVPLRPIEDVVVQGSLL